MNTVAIVGLGLMGGSLARDLAASGMNVLGFDREPKTTEQALAEGVIGAAPRFPEGIAGADLLVLAVPVTAAPQLLSAAVPHLSSRCVLTDLGSTKRSLVRAAEQLGLGARFVGSHPMTGDHLGGWGASRRGLFEGALVYITPASGCSQPTIDAIRSLWSGLGARVRLLGAAEHDQQLAWSSHLPQLVATSLALSLARHGIALEELGPGGRDATRLAGSSPEVWSAITTDNADAIQHALDSVQESLASMATALRTGDTAAVDRLFHEAREWASSGG